MIRTGSGMHRPSKTPAFQTCGARRSPTPTFQQVIGGLYSAIPAEQLPGADQRSAFEDNIRKAVPHAEPFPEQVLVSVLVGRTA